MATRMEAEPFVQGLGLEKIVHDSFHIYSGDKLKLLVSGVGKMNATMTVTFAIMTFSPDCIINLGAAGSLGNGLLGEVFQIRSIIESDRPDRRRNRQRLYSPQRLEGFNDCVLATRDIPVLDPLERAKVAAEADLIDMEGCAVAHVCKRFKLDCYLYKYVTDNMESPDISDIVENIEKYGQSFFQYCVSLVFPRFQL